MGSLHVQSSEIGPLFLKTSIESVCRNSGDWGKPYRILSLLLELGAVISDDYSFH